MYSLEINYYYYYYYRWVVLQSIRGGKCDIVQGPIPVHLRSLSPEVDGLSDLPWKILCLPVYYTGGVPVDMMSGVSVGVPTEPTNRFQPRRTSYAP